MTVGKTHQDGQSGLPTSNSSASFWHSQPSEALTGHRTTELLPKFTDVVIVGSGISGAFAARHLAEDEAGKDLGVVMLEAREACWGATGRNGGHCQPHLFGRPPHIGRFELANFESLKRLVEENDISCEWQNVEGCAAYMTEGLFQNSVAEVQRLWEEDEELGRTVHFTRAGVDKSKLRLAPNVVGAVVQHNAASLWPYKLVSWVLESLLATRSAARPFDGHDTGTFNLQTNTPVTNIQKLDDGTWIVHTTRGMLHTRKILLATNGYTSHLLPAFSDLIVPVQGQVAALIPPQALFPQKTPLAGHNSYGVLGNTSPTNSYDDYLIQRPFANNGQGGGELVFGGGRGLSRNTGVGVSDDSYIDQSTKHYLRTALNDILTLESPRVELQPTHEWSGIMGYSRDSAPWVGNVPSSLGGNENLFICAGYTGHGMPNASLSAKAAVMLLLGKELKDEELPGEFKISEERLKRAKALEDVKASWVEGERESYV